MSVLGEYVVVGLYIVILFLWYWMSVLGELVVAGLYGVILFLWYWMSVLESKLLRVSILLSCFFGIG